MKQSRSTIILIIVFIMGLSLLLYPTVADRWNARTQSRAIASYTESIADLDEDRYKELWDAADKYNAELAGLANRYAPSDEMHRQYMSVLDVSGSGVMGYVEIPSIKVSLPIYHGTGHEVLQTAIGHIEGTTLPTGGVGGHIALSGHRGLPSARLFTDIDQLVVGDVFVLNVLDRVLTYEVDQIRIVLPHELENLEIDPNEDYCTLVTCTPYGVNSHRLLVRGHRIENLEENRPVNIVAEAFLMDTLLVAPLVAAPLLLLGLVWLLVKYRKNDDDEGETT